ncbi:MAG: manganese efflux pump [Paludibacteraceae bacterium]|nr:manganese efflux pump [Paludibacteraceae bacterium]MBR2262415.1 manganese efflux pump [Paludibacteraceae bacterium]MEE3484063.1 manganese efflux pump [Bacteroidales bacterium]
MSLVTVILLAIALAMDCLVVSIANGITLRHIQWVPILKMSFLFGLFQAAMPLVGWSAGIWFKDIIAAWDHWIALIILSVLGGKMIKESLFEKEDENEQPAIRWKMLIALAVATSIDALVTGLLFVTEPIHLFILDLVIIGVVSFIFSVVGNTIGIFMGKHLPINMKLVGGLLLIGIGLKIFLEHTNFLSNLFS